MPPKRVQKQPGPKVIHWYRTDLRLHDSPSLNHALSLSPSFLYPIWTWDPHYVYRARVGVNRWQFLIDCQRDLSSNLRKLNPKQKLLVLREAPQSVLPKLVNQWGIDVVVFEKDTDAYARQRDEEVTKTLQAMGVKVVAVPGRTLYDSDELVKQNGGKPTMSITQVQAAAKKLGPVAKPIPAPTSLPDPGSTTLEEVVQTMPDAKPDLNSTVRTEGEEQSYAFGIAGPKNDFSVPTMEELGLAEATTPHHGGETLALAILDKLLEDESFIATFEKPKTAPTAFEPQSTCLTSPHLHFGSLGIREFWWRVQAVLDKHKSHSEPPTSLHGQLLFRDMYFGAQAALGFSFSQQTGNKVCRFIPWHLPSTHDPKTGLITGDYEIDDPVAEDYFQRWKTGRTGFPFIDALMRQLRLEGWIHHLGRHMVACFLTRGGCYIHWERGAEVFEELLIDHETACNAGNWMWLSCAAFYSQFYRCYSPIAFGVKWDKEGAYIRKYVPELANLDKKYIYEPWKAPITDQRKAGVVIKGDGTGGEQDANGVNVYPKPMFDFPERREISIQGMKSAYGVGLYGNDPRVLNGTWKELFPDDAEGPTRGRKGGIGGESGDVVGSGVDVKDVADDGFDGGAAEVERAVVKESASTRTTRGHKRARGQETLESAFKKTRR